MFITFEGPEGAGKSTLIQALSGRLQQSGQAVLVTREPGAGAVGSKIRAILLDGDEVHPRAEMFLFLYFVMTGLHGLHMVVGIGLVAWIIKRANRGDFTPEYNIPVEITGLYWHFVDIVWIFLYPLLYLIQPPHH